MSDHLVEAQAGGWYAFLSIVFTMISFSDVMNLFKDLSVIGAVGCSIMAMRYYYYATKKARQ